MRLLLRRTAPAVASRRSSRAMATAMTTDAAADAARSSSSKPAATAMKTNAADDNSRRPPALDPDPLDLDLAAAAFTLSPSAALGLDRTGAAADASKGPRVDHLVVTSEFEEDLASFVAKRSWISREHAVALLELGAVWWCPVPPPPPRSYGSAADSTPAAVDARAAAEERHRSGRERHGKGMHLFKPRRAGLGDRPPMGSYVRVHVRPKRYFYLQADKAESEEEGEEEREEKEGEESMLPTSLSRVGYGARAWSRRLVSVSAEFAILNKPPCVPSVPTVDNGVEHALSGAATGIAEVLRLREERRTSEGLEAAEAAREAAEAGLPPLPLRLGRRPPKGPQATGAAATGSLAAAHRLDHGASGCLAIGRSARFVAGFQELSKRGRISKVYRAALVAPAAAETETAGTSSSSSAAPPRPPLPRAGEHLMRPLKIFQN